MGIVLRDGAVLPHINEFHELTSGPAPTGVVLGLPAEPELLVVGCAGAHTALREALTPIAPATWSYVDDARQALARMAESPPDLLFVDAADERALELCRVLKGQLMTATIGMIAVGDDERGREGAIDAGCDYFIAAQFSASELYSRSLHLLRTRTLFRSMLDKHDEERQRRDWVRYLVHDLRNGLSAIISNFEYVGETLRDIADDDTTAAIKEASFSARRMAALLQDMLDVDRFRRHELRPRMARLDLAQLLAQAAADVRLVARARGSRVMVAAPSCEIDGDRALLERVLANLLGNAVRYAKSCIRVGAELVGEDRVRIVVANDGPPVPAEARDRIFVPFIQLDGGRGGGAGLGLAFCRLALQAHGGSIALSDVSEECAFVLTLPRRTAAR